jgi:hypothetical protein
LYQKKATTVTIGSTGLSSTGEFFKVKYWVCKKGKLGKIGKLRKLGKRWKRGKKYSCFVPEEGYHRYNGSTGLSITGEFFKVKYWVCKKGKIGKIGKLRKLGKIGKRGKRRKTHSCFVPEEGYYRYNGVYGPVKYWWVFWKMDGIYVR